MHDGGGGTCIRVAPLRGVRARAARRQRPAARHPLPWRPRQRVRRSLPRQAGGAPDIPRGDGRGGGPHLDPTGLHRENRRVGTGDRAVTAVCQPARGRPGDGGADDGCIAPQHPASATRGGATLGAWRIRTTEQLHRCHSDSTTLSCQSACPIWCTCYGGRPPLSVPLHQLDNPQRLPALRGTHLAFLLALRY